MQVESMSRLQMNLSAAGSSAFVTPTLHFAVFVGCCMCLNILALEEG